MHCEACGHWLTGRKTVYEDGTVLVTFTTPTGQGLCGILSTLTKAEFGCVAYAQGDHVEVTYKTGAPWQHFTMIPCPQCSGSPGGGHCMCAGTGLTRQYDDGYVGDERTRRHPKEGTEIIKVDPGTVLAPQPRPDPLAGASL